jgi:hypothetical protein
VIDGDHPQATFVRRPEQHEKAGPERRVHPRLEVVVPVEIDVGVYGVTTAGVTVNLSRGGVLANVADAIEVGEHCTVRFPKPGSRSDSIKSGTIVRAEKLGNGNLIALQFDAELPTAPGLR